MASDSLFASAAGLRAFQVEAEGVQQSEDASAGECARTILAERFRLTNPSTLTTGQAQPMSVIGLKQ
jgi:hypothetical protein